MKPTGAAYAIRMRDLGVCVHCAQWTRQTGSGIGKE